MHDGLIVPLSAAEAAAEALQAAYLTHAGEEPRMEVSWAEAGEIRRRFA